MTSFSNLGIILTCVFGVILLGLVIELYYFFWWKKRLTKTQNQDQQMEHNSKLSFLFCWKLPISPFNSGRREEVKSTAQSNGNERQEEEEEEEEEEEDDDIEIGNSRETLLKGLVEESIDSELIRQHNLSGPPRFLFTIKEETKEDLESEDGRDGKDSRTRSLSDLLLGVDDSTSLTPLPSPPVKNGFNPLFESFTEAELNKLRSSPPPKFKFLRDAEEKLVKRLFEEADKREVEKGGSFQDSVPEKDGSFLKFLNSKNQRERETLKKQKTPIMYSGSSKVLPLDTSSTLTQSGMRNSGRQ